MIFVDPLWIIPLGYFYLFTYIYHSNSKICLKLYIRNQRASNNVKKKYNINKIGIVE